MDEIRRNKFETIKIWRISSNLPRCYNSSAIRPKAMLGLVWPYEIRRKYPNAYTQEVMQSLLLYHSAFKGHATTKKRCALETRMAEMSCSPGNLLRARSSFAYSKINFPFSPKLHKEKTERSKAWNPHHTPLSTINNYEIIAGHAQELSRPSCSKAVNVVGVKVYFGFLILLIKSIFSDNFLYCF